MNYEKCTICGNPLDRVTQQASQTGGVLKEGWAHEVCHLRHIARSRLDRIEELTDRVEELEHLLWDRDRPQGRGLVQRALMWLLWKC